MIFIDPLEIIQWDYMLMILRSSQVILIWSPPVIRRKNRLQNCIIGVWQISGLSTAKKTALYYSTWKTSQSLETLPVSKQRLCKLIGSNLCNIWECYLMKNYIGMSTSIRFAHHLWSILEFLTTLKISFRKGLQDNFILPLFILGFSME